MDTKILKVDNDKRLVFGIASVADVVDSQGDIISADVLEQAAHRYVERSRKAGVQHERGSIGTLIESVVLTKSAQRALGIELPKVVWWVGYKIEDESVWQRIKSSELQGFSIGGRGERVEGQA